MRTVAHLVLGLLFFVSFALTHECIHDIIAPAHFTQNLPVIPGVIHRDRKRATPDPIRIVFNTDFLESDPDRLCTYTGQRIKTGDPSGNEDCSATCLQNGNCQNCWYNCEADEVFIVEKKEFLLNRVIPDVLEYFTNALAVEPVIGNLVLAGQNECACSNTPGVPIPDSYKTTGVSNADMVIFITARSTRFRSRTIAFACNCAGTALSGRPLAGYINWGPNAIDLDTYSYPEQLGVGIHELTHALGFTSGKFASFGNGSSTNTVTRDINEGTLGPHSITLLTTPKVVEVARKHFGCSSIDGVELENGGAPGTVSSHWERRILYNEYMTGYSSYDPSYSEFTLALLEDSGWYFPNYSAATPLVFGRGLGCDFVNKRCNSRSGPYFCKQDTEGCTHDGLRKGRCNVGVLNSNLESWYQYYGAPNVGGSDNLADYCGMYTYRETLKGDCTISEYNDQTDNNYYYLNSFGETYCPNCRCLSAYEDGVGSGGSCHNITCYNGAVRVKIGLIWYECENGKQIQVTEGFDGYYKCPDSSICSSVVADNSPWPTITSIEPKEGKVGDTVTITGTNFGTDPQVVFGLYHGCIDPKVEGNTITCVIGVRDNAPEFKGSKEVDIVLIDQNTGKSAYEEKGFTLSPGALNIPSFILVNSLLAVTWLFYQIMY